MPGHSGKRSISRRPAPFLRGLALLPVFWGQAGADSADPLRQAQWSLNCGEDAQAYAAYARMAQKSGDALAQFNDAPAPLYRLETTMP